MNASPNVRAKHLTITAATLIAIAAVAGAWVLPPAAEAGPAPSVSIEPATAETENTAAITIGWVSASAGDRDPVHVNIPADPIQEGQFCQGYGVVHVGSAPYHFEWSGQFDNSNASSGPLGPKQIVNGNVAKSRGNLTVHVYDSIGGTLIDDATATLDIETTNPFNSGCAA